MHAWLGSNLVGTAEESWWLWIRDIWANRASRETIYILLRMNVPGASAQTPFLLASHFIAFYIIIVSFKCVESAHINEVIVQDNVPKRNIHQFSHRPFDRKTLHSLSLSPCNSFHPYIQLLRIVISPIWFALSILRISVLIPNHILYHSCDNLFVPSESFSWGGSRRSSWIGIH